MNLSPSIQTEILIGDPQQISQIPEYKLRDLSAEAVWTRQSDLWQELQKNLS